MSDKTTKLIGMIKELSKNLGYVPSRDEAVVFLNRRQIESVFGSYTGLLKAAGLESRKEFQDIKSEVRDVFTPVIDRQNVPGEIQITHSEEILCNIGKLQEKKIRNLYVPSKKILCIPDIHAPFQDNDALKAIIEIAHAEKPDLIIQLGDAFDLFSFSKFPHVKTMTCKDEVLEARATLESMWDALRASTSGSTQFVALFGNHEQRMFKRMLETIPAILDFFNWKEVFEFKGVYAEMQDRNPFVFEGINFVHGWRTQLGQHMRWLNGPTVHGHTHRPGFVTMQLNNEIIWEVDSGHVSDVSQIPMQYTASKITHWAKACTMIDRYGPRIILL